MWRLVCVKVQGTSRKRCHKGWESLHLMLGRNQTCYRKEAEAVAMAEVVPEVSEAPRLSLPL